MVLINSLHWVSVALSGRMSRLGEMRPDVSDFSGSVFHSRSASLLVWIWAVRSKSTRLKRGSILGSLILETSAEDRWTLPREKGNRVQNCEMSVPSPRASIRYSASVVAPSPNIRSCCARKTVSTALLFSNAPASPDAETIWSAHRGSSLRVLLAISARSRPNMSAGLAKVCETATPVASAEVLKTTALFP